MINEWKIWDGNYDKEFYDIRLSNGEIVKWCWPNAGKLNETRGTTRRSWTPDQNIEIMFTPEWLEFNKLE